MSVLVDFMAHSLLPVRVLRGAPNDVEASAAVRWGCAVCRKGAALSRVNAFCDPGLKTHIITIG